MALMFQRLAHNFAKNGYYPTDSETISRILSMLSPCESGEMRILDPCAGEGVALAECKAHLDQSRTLSYGIEYDKERAWHAKSLLNTCIHGDMQHCVISQKSFGLLFLNPPYGDMVSDDNFYTSSFVQKGRKRLEKLFYQRTVGSLQFGGILILIIPFYVLDEEFAHWISRNFTRVEIFSACDKQFKQIVLFGIREKLENISSPQVIKKHLIEIGKVECIDQIPELPEEGSDHVQYVIPEYPKNDLKFQIANLDVDQLAIETSRNPCLWEQFHQKFQNVGLAPRRPLMPLSKWHLALALAAGQVTGLVTSFDHRTFIIKGDTYKAVQEKLDWEETSQGDFIEVKHELDKFVSVIKAIDMTPKSQTFGNVFTIK